ncbi:hypothetical protein [Bdellovibrio bacteriovorus]|uniref:hypothetical protein n=1 Tax=Bdellovibrio bacteriovorus TaxID=959 RepID=UPI000A7DF36B|nr:hypothetical protein [Bdellovibrio bacteriovorus]
MKHMPTLIPVIALSLFTAACGEYQKDPAPGLATMRENAKVQTQQGPDKPREITKTVVVEKPVLVVKEESTIDEKFIVITPDAQMTFNEGQQAQFKIRARVLVPGIEIKLSAQGLPEGARLEKSTQEKDLYILTWNPALYTVPANAAMKSYTAKVVAEVSKANTQAEADKLKGLVREKEFNIFLFRNQEAPSGLTVTGLNSEVNEGSLVPFTVTVKIPGIDNKAPQKPRLVVSYDGVSYTAGNSFLELDGARYVVADLNKKDAEYLGDSNWKFTLIFDTKNISVQPQLAKDGAIMASADGTRVRLSFKVYSPYGLSTPESLTQVKVRYTKAIQAPRFDLSGLGQQGLVVSPGQSVNLKFAVSSADNQALVKVESAVSTLPGTPVVECKNSATTAAKQECSLTWTVPCDAKSEQLNGEITMNAQAVINGRNSDVTPYKLKVVASTEDKKLCATEAAQ